MLEVVIIERSPIKWEWQVCDRHGATIIHGWEKNRRAAGRYSSYWQPAKTARLKYPDPGTVLSSRVLRIGPTIGKVTFKRPLPALAFPRAWAASCHTFSATFNRAQ
jgi:hypothetical protein